MSESFCKTPDFHYIVHLTSVKPKFDFFPIFFSVDHATAKHLFYVIEIVALLAFPPSF